MLFYAITGLINAVGSAFLGLFVYFKNRKETLNKTFDRKKILNEWFLSDVNKELEINALRNRIKELEEKLHKKEEEG